MSLGNVSQLGQINDQAFGRSSSSLVILSSTEPREQRTSRVLVAGIVLLVLSILVLLAGFGCLITGIIQATPLFIVVGAGLIGFGVVGVLVAGILIGLAQHRDNLLLREENERVREIERNTNRRAEDLRKKLKMTEVSFATSQESVNKLLRRLASVQNDYDDLVEQKDALEKKCEILREDVSLLRQKGASDLHESDKLKEKLKLLEKEKNQALQRLTETLKKNEMLENDNETLVKAQQKLVTELLDENKSLKEVLKELEKVSPEEVEKNKSVLQEIEMQMQSAQRQFSILKQKLQTSECRLSENNQKLIEIQELIKEAAAALDKEQRDLAWVRSERFLPVQHRRLQQELLNKQTELKQREMLIAIKEAALEKEKASLAIREKELSKDDKS